MNVNCVNLVKTACLAAIICGLSVASPAGAQSPDQRMAAAKQYVDKSDKYLHHSQLTRGMTGYGLTVMAGTKIERFEFEVVSVMKKWGPHQDVILARLSGLGLEKTGVIAGMSGSPCYITHEGKDKLIGAVAFGWTSPKEPLCGLQPITQMLASAGVPGSLKRQPTTAPVTSQSATGVVRSGVSDDLLRAVLDPAKRDFAKMLLPKRKAGGLSTSPKMVPLPTPVMTAGLTDRSMARLTEDLAFTGMVPVAAGGVTGAQTDTTVKLEPGSAISIPMVTGDSGAAYAPIGTVTEVIGDKVLAFGHAFEGQGDCKMPMGTAYVHTIVSSVFKSFKLASPMEVTGTLEHDEIVGVTGTVGPIPSMIPMTLEVHWEDMTDQPSHVQRYKFNLMRHRWLTPLLAVLLVQDAVWEWRNPPQDHTIRHDVEIDFGKLGIYRTSDVFVGRDIMPATSDISRPLAMVLNNPYGEAPDIESIKVKVTVQQGRDDASIVQLKLDGKVYRPGEKITAKLILQPYKKPRSTLKVSFALPDDLPDGKYKLTACDWYRDINSRRSEKPHLFATENAQQVFDAVQRIVSNRSDVLYLRLPIARRGLALKQQELPNLPESKSAILSGTGKIDIRSYTETIIRPVKIGRVLSGSATAEFEVNSEPTETLIRQ